MKNLKELRIIAENVKITRDAWITGPDDLEKEYDNAMKLFKVTFKPSKVIELIDAIENKKKAKDKT